MHRAYLPFLFLPTHAARALLGRNLDKVALLALRAILEHRKSLEVAHQQIRFAGHDLAFSSRVTARGDLVVDLDIGDPRLADRLVLEEDIRRAGREVKGISRDGRRRAG